MKIATIEHAAWKPVNCELVALRSTWRDSPVTAQLAWSDGAESGTFTCSPCEGVGDSTCARMAE